MEALQRKKSSQTEFSSVGGGDCKGRPPESPPGPLPRLRDEQPVQPTGMAEVEAAESPHVTFSGVRDVKFVLEKFMSEEATDTVAKSIKAQSGAVVFDLRGLSRAQRETLQRASELRRGDGKLPARDMYAPFDIANGASESSEGAQYRRQLVLKALAKDNPRIPPSRLERAVEPALNCVMACVEHVAKRTSVRHAYVDVSRMKPGYVIGSATLGTLAAFAHSMGYPLHPRDDFMVFGDKDPGFEDQLPALLHDLLGPEVAMILDGATRVDEGGQDKLVRPRKPVLLASIPEQSMEAVRLERNKLEREFAECFEPLSGEGCAPPDEEPGPMPLLSPLSEEAPRQLPHLLEALDSGEIEPPPTDVAAMDQASLTDGREVGRMVGFEIEPADRS